MLCAGCLLNFLLFADDKQTLHSWHAALRERLASLRLTIHPHAQPRPVTEGVPFLGFIVYPTHRRVKPRKVVHYRHKLRCQLAKYRAGEIDQQAVQSSILGWLNHVQYGDTWGLRSAVLQEVVL